MNMSYGLYVALRTDVFTYQNLVDCLLAINRWFGSWYSCQLGAGRGTGKRADGQDRHKC